MRIIKLLLLLFTTSVLANSEVTTQIHDVDYAKHAGEKDLLFLESGHVIPLPKEKINFDVNNRHTLWKFILNEKNEILEMNQVTSSPKTTTILNMQTDY